MATVADIEPASLEVTPGEPGTFTLTIRNDGDDVEAYHLSTVDDAAEFVVIEPDTLLVHPGQTATSTATITLEHTGRWSVGELIVRFHIVPASQPDDFLVVEAIATIQSFSDVAAVLSHPSLEGRRRAETEIAIANAGNAHAYADVAVSAGELVVSLDRAQVALPANSTESVDLSVRPRALLWRGEPVQHPFVVTVNPEGQPGITLEGTFTQLPLLPGWTFKALIGVAGALAALLLIWLGALLIGGLRPGPAEKVAATETESAPPTESVTPVVVELAPPDAAPPAGDPVTTTMEVTVADPPDALVAVAVEWSPVLALVGHECEQWIDPNTGEEPVTPLSGDECLIDPTSGSADQVDVGLTFTTPPQGLTTDDEATVTATPTSFVTVSGGDLETLPDRPDAVAADPLVMTAAPYPFWMQLEVLSPSDSHDDATRWGTVHVHRTLTGDDAQATMAFDLFPPPFADAQLLTFASSLQDRPIPPDEAHLGAGCDVVSGNQCSLIFVVDDSTFGDLQEWSAPFELDLTDDPRGEGGLIVARGAEDAVPVPADQVLPAAAPLVVGDAPFPVQLELDRNRDSVDATLQLTQATFAGEVETSDDDLETVVSGSRMLAVTIAWPESLELSDAPKYCARDEHRDRQLVCTFSTPSEAAALPAVELSFSVEDDDADEATIAARGEMLTFEPEGELERHDDVGDPPLWPLRWIATDLATVELD